MSHSSDPKNKPHDEKQFLTDIGSKSTIERFTLGMEQASVPNRQLIMLGLSFMDDDKLKLQSYRYFGSCATHIYFNETLKQLDFVAQTQPLLLYQCPQPLAAKAIDNLVGDLKQNYGQRRGRLRSGF